jgi:hypothetical protein
MAAVVALNGSIGARFPSLHPVGSMAVLPI